MAGNGYDAGDRLHEECGVFGIFGRPGTQAAPDILEGLIALQHRGQESAGISVTDTDGPKGCVLTRKGMGLVSEVFTAADMDSLHGNIGIGHVRYSTSGGSIPENAQPIAMTYIKGSLALVHNGNIMNAEQLRQEQLFRGQPHYTTSDTECLAYEIISERIGTGTIEEAVRNAAGKLRGGYACIVMSPRKLVGFRDPYGIKPMVLGSRAGTYMLASESAAVTAVGGEVIRDVRPGEILTITEKGISSDDSLCRLQIPAHCAFEYIYFARPDSVMDGIRVHTARYRAGCALAVSSGVEADIVTGVPDSGLIAAEGYADASGILFALAFHKNSYVGRSFIRPTDMERKAAVSRKLSVLDSVVRSKRIILIDDSIVRGTTMKQIVSMLKEAGAVEVHVRISSPPFLYPCYYGTDVPGRGELIASSSTGEDICRYIGADSLAYLSLGDLQSVTEGLPLCMACFNNEYPVKNT